MRHLLGWLAAGVVVGWTAYQSARILLDRLTRAHDQRLADELIRRAGAKPQGPQEPDWRRLHHWGARNAAQFMRAERRLRERQG